tara:strand:+ start:117847 stop:118434 length:588 start_codon:yes stop_codon:yes gene_type:complete
MPIRFRGPVKPKKLITPDPINIPAIRNDKVPKIKSEVQYYKENGEMPSDTAHLVFGSTLGSGTYVDENTDMTRSYALDGNTDTVTERWYCSMTSSFVKAQWSTTLPFTGTIRCVFDVGSNTTSPKTGLFRISWNNTSGQNTYAYNNTHMPLAVKGSWTRYEMDFSVTDMNLIVFRGQHTGGGGPAFRIRSLELME